MQAAPDVRLTRLGRRSPRGESKLTTLRHHLVARVGMVAAATLGAVSGVGCGYTVNDDPTARFLYVEQCDRDSDEERLVSDVVLLEWNGGFTPLYPDEEFGELDLSAFETADGGTLADDPAAFKELVRQQITRVFCDSDGPGILVEHADQEDFLDETVVYFTQVLSPLGGFEVGEGEYDPCNRQHDNAAVIFGGQVRQLDRRFTFDEWVMVFANIASHEIGHMLGYGHIGRDEIPQTGRPVYIELMLDAHTPDELRREHRFVYEQSSCPAGLFRFMRRTEDPAVLTHGLASDADPR